MQCFSNCPGLRPGSRFLPGNLHARGRVCSAAQESKADPIKVARSSKSNKLTRLAGITAWHSTGVHLIRYLRIQSNLEWHLVTLTRRHVSSWLAIKWTRFRYVISRQGASLSTAAQRQTDGSCILESRIVASDGTVSVVFPWRSWRRLPAIA